jgi:hypothetical protein
LLLLLGLETGCVTVRPSRIDEFIEKLSQHEFTLPQREAIGEVLDYVNELEQIRCD